MRTMPMTWNQGEQTAGAGKEPCACCGKAVNPKRMWAVHVINGGTDVLHPADEHLYVSDADDMGAHMVGSECRKRFGEFAFKWEQ
jgi:hypothetical protein